MYSVQCTLYTVHCTMLQYSFLGTRRSRCLVKQFQPAILHLWMRLGPNYYLVFMFILVTYTNNVGVLFMKASTTGVVLETLSTC